MTMGKKCAWIVFLLPLLTILGLYAKQNPAGDDHDFDLLIRHGMVHEGSLD